MKRTKERRQARLKKIRWPAYKTNIKYLATTDYREVRFLLTTKQLLNTNQRLYHHERAKRVKFLRNMAFTLGRRLDPIRTPVQLHVTFHPATNHRRDTPNLYPTAKALLDGLVDAGVLPDDNDRVITQYTFHPGKKRTDGKNEMILRLEYVPKDRSLSG